jgi:nitrogen regulatory protein P-II 1
MKPCRFCKVNTMKMIKAMIRPEKFEAIKMALDEAGFGALTVFDVEGRGVQKGIKQQYRGAEYITDLIPKRQLEIVVADESAEKVIEVIKKAAYTGKIGDGQIFVLPVEDSIRVRTGERGNSGI